MDGVFWGHSDLLNGSIQHWSFSTMTHNLEGLRDHAYVSTMGGFMYGRKYRPLGQNDMKNISILDDL